MRALNFNLWVSEGQMRLWMMLFRIVIRASPFKTSISISWSQNVAIKDIIQIVSEGSLSKTFILGL